MAMKGKTTCAVHGCNRPIWGFNNLCDEHRLPGMAAGTADSTMILTVWVAEHGDEVGVIVLNDWALGDYFGGRKGFEAQLAEQGFVNVRNLETPEELDAAERPPKGKKIGHWSGPWRTEYPWEKSDAPRQHIDPDTLYKRQVAMRTAQIRFFGRVDDEIYGV